MGGDKKRRLRSQNDKGLASSGHVRYVLGVFVLSFFSLK